MRRIILPLFLFALLTLPAQAQDGYRLRVPDANDYLPRINGLLAADSGVDGNMLRVILDGMKTDHIALETASYPDLLATYNRLLETVPFMIDNTAWNSAILTTALREHRFTANTADVVTFDQYELGVTPVDWNADGTDEYLLRVLYKPFENRTLNIDGEYDAYHILYRNADGDLVATGTPLRGNYAGMAGWEEGYWWTRLLEDVNRDGKPEWVVIQSGDNTGPGAYSRGFLRIFAWRDGRLVNIAPDDFGFHNDSQNNVSWGWEDVSNDGILEFAVTQGHNNSWGCSYETRRQIDWSAATDRYEYTIETDTIPERFGCVITAAEAAMWANDYPLAVSRYEQAFDVGIADDDRLLSRYQYAQVRLVLAYTMSGELDAAQALIDDLKRQTFEYEGITGLVDAASGVDLEQDDSAYQLCKAMHDYFEGNYGGFDFYIGYTLVDNEMFALDPHPAPQPNRAGCDLDHLILSRLGDAPFALDEPPLARFEAVSAPVRYSFSTDLNQDGFEEWLIYPDTFIAPYFFASDTTLNQYVLSYPDLPTEIDSEMVVFPLPDSNENALLTISATAPYYRMCGTDVEKYLLLWRLVDMRLVRFFGSSVCEPLSPDDIVQDGGRSLYLWRSSACASGEATYVWDGDEYELSDRSCYTEPYFDTFYDSPEDNRPAAFSAQIDNLYRALLYDPGTIKDTAGVLREYMNDNLSWASDDDVFRGRYFYALALEALSRPDEALAEYVAIYEAAPESAWGMLAALHFERSDGGE